MTLNEMDVSPDRALSGEPQRFDVTWKSLTFSCRFTARKGARRLFVVMRSFVDRPSQQPPVFRSYATARLKGHMLEVCDPTLFLDPTIRTSCFLGTRRDDAVDGLLDLTRAVARPLGLSDVDVTFWAASGAGLGAAVAATRCEAGAVLIDPLLHLPTFRQAAPAATILKIFDPTSSFEAVFRTTPLRMSAMASLTAARAAGRRPRLVIAQNIADGAFYKRQYLPFCAAFRVPAAGGTDPTGDITTISFTAQASHGVETPALLDQLVALAHGPATP